MGLQGIDIADLLRENQVECEYADTDYVVLMFTPENSEKDYNRVADICCSLSPQSPNNSQISINSLQMKPAMSIRQAVFSNHELIPVELAEGRICSAPTVSCPPAVPISISGEILTNQTIQMFQRYGISFVDVVSKE
jgi:arginine/lysine/ornithine decarboxylase